MDSTQRYYEIYAKLMSVRMAATVVRVTWIRFVDVI
jgi:hypothetical protein